MARRVDRGVSGAVVVIHRSRRSSRRHPTSSARKHSAHSKLARSKSRQILLIPRCIQGGLGKKRTEWKPDSAVNRVALLCRRGRVCSVNGTGAYRDTQNGYDRVPAMDGTAPRCPPRAPGCQGVRGALPGQPFRVRPALHATQPDDETAQRRVPEWCLDEWREETIEHICPTGVSTRPTSS